MKEGEGKKTKKGHLGSKKQNQQEGGGRRAERRDSGEVVIASSLIEFRKHLDNTPGHMV